MRTDLAHLVGLPRGDLLAMARASLMEQASRIYDKEALTIVEEIFSKNMSIMGKEQLAHIVLYSEGAFA